MTTYQLFPALDGPTEAALRVSIERWGVISPITVDQHGNIIDGHHRSRIASEVGAECPTLVRPVADADEARSLGATLNTDRRHLTVDQRRQVVADLRQQGHSERAIAGALGISPATAHRDIEHATASGEAVQPETVRGLDGRQRPSTRPTSLPSEPDDEPLFAPGEDRAIVDELAGHGDVTEADVEAAVAECVESKRIPHPVHKPDVGGGVSHPARFTSPLLALFRDLLDEHAPGRVVLDPFAGTGRIHELRPEWETWGIEIEPEWATISEWTIQGSALHLPLADGSVDAIVTSPTYGNRLADSHNASDPERRRSYTHDLGRALHPDNSGAMHWGDQYRAFHEAAWVEAVRALAPGGVFLLNIKDHIRGGDRQYVAGWHVTALARLGCTLLHHVEIDTGSLRQGANGHLRLPEQIYVLRRDQ